MAGCGPAFDNAMGAAYDKKVHDDCVTTASTNNPAALAEAYCSCVVVQLDKLTVQQRMALTPTSPEIHDAAATCNAQVQATAPTNDVSAPPPSNAGM